MIYKKIFINYIILVLILFCGTNTFALEVRITGDRLSVHVDQVPLQSILQRIADLGVTIREDCQNYATIFLIGCTFVFSVKVSVL